MLLLAQVLLLPWWMRISFFLFVYKVKTKVGLFVRASCAETGPPLGTVLGNIGANAAKFVKDFNDYTKELPSYFLLKVHIFILEDRSVLFSVFLPTTGFILSLLKITKIVEGTSKKLFYVSLRNLVQLALLKFPGKSLETSLAMVLGSAHASGFLLVFE